jgi:hypothetical protein
MVPKPKTHVLSFYKTCCPNILLIFVAFGGNCVVCLFRVMLVILYACASMYFGIPQRGKYGSSCVIGEDSWGIQPVVVQL